MNCLSELNDEIDRVAMNGEQQCRAQPDQQHGFDRFEGDNQGKSDDRRTEIMRGGDRSRRETPPLTPPDSQLPRSASCTAHARVTR